jgi:hypothetical protein
VKKHWEVVMSEIFGAARLSGYSLMRLDSEVSLKTAKRFSRILASSLPEPT